MKYLGHSVIAVLSRKISSQAMKKVQSLCCDNRLTKHKKNFYNLLAQNFDSWKKSLAPDGAVRSTQPGKNKYMLKPKNSRTLFGIISNFNKRRICRKGVRHSNTNCVQSNIPRRKVVSNKCENSSIVHCFNLNKQPSRKVINLKRKFDDIEPVFSSKNVFDVLTPKRTKRIRRQYSTISPAVLRTTEVGKIKPLKRVRISSRRNYDVQRTKFRHNAVVDAVNNRNKQHYTNIYSNTTKEDLINNSEIPKAKKYIKKTVRLISNLDNNAFRLKKNSMAVEEEIEQPLDYKMIEFNKKPYRYRYEKEEDVNKSFTFYTPENFHQGSLQKPTTLTRAKNFVNSACRLAYELAVSKLNHELEGKEDASVFNTAWKKQKHSNKIKQKNKEVFWETAQKKWNSVLGIDISDSTFYPEINVPQANVDLQQKTGVINNILTLYDKIKKDNSSLRHVVSLNCAQPEDVLDMSKKTKRTTILDLILNKKREKMGACINYHALPIPALNSEYLEPLKNQKTAKSSATKLLDNFDINDKIPDASENEKSHQYDLKSQSTTKKSRKYKPYKFNPKITSYKEVEPPTAREIEDDDPGKIVRPYHSLPIISLAKTNRFKLVGSEDAEVTPKHFSRNDDDNENKYDAQLQFLNGCDSPESKINVQTFDEHHAVSQPSKETYNSNETYGKDIMDTSRSSRMATRSPEVAEDEHDDKRIEGGDSIANPKFSEKTTYNFGIFKKSNSFANKRSSSFLSSGGEDINKEIDKNYKSITSLRLLKKQQQLSSKIKPIFVFNKRNVNFIDRISGKDTEGKIIEIDELIASLKLSDKQKQQKISTDKKSNLLNKINVILKAKNMKDDFIENNELIAGLRLLDKQKHLSTKNKSNFLIKNTTNFKDTGSEEDARNESTENLKLVEKIQKSDDSKMHKNHLMSKRGGNSNDEGYKEGFKKQSKIRKFKFDPIFYEYQPTKTTQAPPEKNCKPKTGNELKISGIESIMYKYKVDPFKSKSLGKETMVGKNIVKNIPTMRSKNISVDRKFDRENDNTNALDNYVMEYSESVARNCRNQLYDHAKKTVNTKPRLTGLPVSHPLSRFDRQAMRNAGRSTQFSPLRAPFSYTTRHLWRLPKTTPEGYRIVMYAVKDNDPTKMVFADCVKTFCMFNDIVLSEDGIMDGYIVVFDMKGVQLGHLARVSLPALRCFFLYIQEAHPVKIKGVHVLNTASWVHHIMRLVIPMVKSELLSLVKFHKGNHPEGLPLDIMPMEYGGDTSSMEELDRETESLWAKYRQWLLDNERLKADETKRSSRRSSWWGWPFFGSKSQDDLNEKNILKNLRYE